MKATLYTVLLITIPAVLILVPRHARSHCEIPCGIYGDMTRIVLLREDIATVEKSMGQIIALSDGSNPNQMVRWVNNKEDHSSKIQHVVTQYFMTQRIKPRPASDEEAHATYVAQLTAAHGMLISAMKCKQTTDATHCAALRTSLDDFCNAYFSKEDLEHLKVHE